MDASDFSKGKGFLGFFEPKLFYPTLLAFAAIICFALISPEKCGAFFAAVQKFVLANFSWLILAVGGFSVLFCIWMFLSPHYGDRKLGGEDSKPEFSFYAWVSMCFARVWALVS